jgi:uncharacterized protein DUF3750
MSPSEPVVQLRHASLPSVLRAMAVHHWFVASDPLTGRWERWEVWQDPDAGGTNWGHVHRDLMAPGRGVGGGPASVAAEWRGAAAEAIYDVLSRPEDYPYCSRYHAWPGPNSNTYAAWVLERAGVTYDLDPRAIGKDYLGTFGVRASQGAGIRVETPLIGLRAGPRDGVELHLLCLTIGIQFRPFMLKTPFRRLDLRHPRRGSADALEHPTAR